MNIDEFFNGSDGCRHFALPGCKDILYNHIMFSRPQSGIYISRIISGEYTSTIHCGTITEEQFKQFLSFQITLKQLWMLAKDCSINGLRSQITSELAEKLSAGNKYVRKVF
jgi:hypothetical protein